MNHWITRIMLCCWLISGSITALIAQVQIVCKSNPTANYHVIGSPGSTFLWNTNGNGSISGQGNDSISVSWIPELGDYTLTVMETSKDGCDGVVRSLTIRVAEFSSSVTQFICPGQNFNLPDGLVVNNEGNYTSTISSYLGCDSVVNTEIKFYPVPQTTVSQSFCNGDTFTLPDGVIVSEQGTYTSTLSSIYGCDSIVTTQLKKIEIPQTNITATVCAGKNFTLPNGTQVSTAGIFPVTLTAFTGCDSIVITNLSLIEPILANVDIQVCIGDSYLLPDNSLIFDEGNYPVRLTAFNGCDSIVTFSLTHFNDFPAINLGLDSTICEDSTLTISILPYSGIWQDGNNSSTFDIKKEGIYYVTVSNLCGDFSDTIEIFTEKCFPCGAFMPTAFTPNNDGANDIFNPILSCNNPLPYHFTIYNRWNQLVFESTDPAIGWDGTFKGQPQPNEAYIYLLTYFNSERNQVEKLNGVTLLIR